SNWINEVAFSPDSRRFIVTDRLGWKREYDLSTGIEVASRHDPLSGYWGRQRDDPLGPVAHGILRPRDDSGGFLPQPPGYAGAKRICPPAAQLMATGPATGRPAIWQVDEKLKKPLPRRGRGISVLAFSPGGGRLESGARERRGRGGGVVGGGGKQKIGVPAD